MADASDVWDSDDVLDYRSVEASVEVAALLSDLQDCGEALILERNGEALAAILPMNDLRLYEKLLRQEMDRVDVEAAEAAEREGGPRISLEELMAEQGIDPAA